MTSISQLQQHIAATMKVREDRPRRRKVCDISVAVGTKRLKSWRPRNTIANRCEFIASCTDDAKRRARKCGFGFAVIAVLTFFIHKALQTLWDWWFEKPEHAAAGIAMECGDDVEEE